MDLDQQAQTLVANSGLAAVLKPLSRIVGFLRPQSRCGDAAYDSELEAAFARVAETPLGFDAAGCHTFYSYQVITTETRLIRGELFSLFTETTTGAARIAARGAQTVGSRPVSTDARWYDGILSNDDGFPLAYHFQSAYGKPGIILDSRDVFHHRHLHALGARRGVTALAHAINHIRDIIEIVGDTKAAIKAAAGVALTRKQDVPHGIVPSALGLNSAVQTDVFAPDSGLSGDPVETGPSIPVNFEDYLGGGLFSQVPLDVIHDERPHPNGMAFRESLMREIAVGIGVPHQLLYFMDDPGGAWSRTLLEALAKFIGDQYLNHLRPFCQRFWAYAISKEIKAGRLAPPPRTVSKEKLYNVRWTPPRSMTADLGRIGNLTISLRQHFLQTAAAHYEEMGLDWQDEMTQCANEIAFARNLEATTPGLRPGDLTGWMLPGPPTPAAA